MLGRRLPAQRRGLIMRKRHHTLQNDTTGITNDPSAKHVLNPVEAFVLFQVGPGRC